MRIKTTSGFLAALALLLIIAIAFPVDGQTDDLVRRGRGTVVGNGSMVMLQVTRDTQAPAIVTRVVNGASGTVNLYVLPDGVELLAPELRLSVVHGTDVGQWILAGHL